MCSLSSTPLEDNACNGTRYTVFEIAKCYVAAGLSVIPIRPDGSKAPALGEWKPFQKCLPGPEELQTWFRGRSNGLAIVAGMVSGGLEVLDFEDVALFTSWRELVEAEAPGLVDQLSVVATPRPGRHVYYRCPEIGSSLKLAQTAVTDPKTGKVQVKTLIETRGEGAYVLAPGCPPGCHASGATYRRIAGPRLTEVPVIGAHERRVLLDAARLFNRWVEPRDEPKAGTDPATSDRPGDCYNRQGPDWKHILQPQGWTLAREFGAVQYWRRPGKPAGWSATTGVCRGRAGHDLLYVFSCNASPFEAGRCYSKFAAYTLLNHTGDFGAAARALAEQAYGRSPQDSEGSQESASWEPPVPFGKYSVPEFPTDVLAPWMRNFIKAEATATQTPADLAALLTLAIAGAGVARYVTVRPRDGWEETSNLFVVVALPTGNRKSAVFADCMQPVKAFEKEKFAGLGPKLAEADNERRLLEKRLKVVEDKAAKEDNAEKRKAWSDEAQQLAKQIAGLVSSLPSHEFTEDCTSSKLPDLLAGNAGRMLVACPEGTPFEIAKGRFSDRGPDFDVYLKGHSGDDIRVGRTGRAGASVERPALSLALTVQPDVLFGLAQHPVFRRRGFLGRFHYALPASRVGQRVINPPPVPSGVCRAYQDNMRKLWRLFGKGQVSMPSGARQLVFSTKADQCLQQFEKWLEPQLGEWGQLEELSDWASKLAGAVVRLAGILHLAGRVSSSQPWKVPIDADTVAAAVAIARDYLIPHARAAFAFMGADPRQADAERILKWLATRPACLRSANSANSAEGKPCLAVSKRDVHRSIWGGSRKPADLDPVFDLLVCHNYLRPVEMPRRAGPGQKPSPLYDINPFFLAD